MKVLFIVVALVFGTSALSNKTFPDDFKFGLSTSAYQIEGAWDEDGRGVSMWDDFVHTSGHIVDNSTADIACDSYHKYEEDIALLKGLNVSFYRLSISWTRILNGTGHTVNMPGVNYYLNILKLLKANNIEPIVTLYHWDLPLYLNELGGWTNPDIVPYFGAYAKTCYQYFGEYVKYWVTLNDPPTTCFLGYGTKKNSQPLAPGYDLEAEGVYLCAYTHVKAHALAYHIYQDEFKDKQKGKISLSITTSWYEPASNSSDDLAAQELALQFTTGLFANPIYLGNWPQVVMDRVGNRSQMEGLNKSRLPDFTKEEVEYINGTYDWFGLNYYLTYMVNYTYKEDDLLQNASYRIDEGFTAYADPAWPHSNGSTWLTVVPWGLRNVLKWIHKTYNKPEIIITENGWADDGTINDTKRIDYMEKHLSVILDAIYEDEINVQGYTHWSLLDNFEWTSGYTSKFGIVSVNFTSENRTRTPKQSYYWYKDLIRSKCLVDSCESTTTVAPATTTVVPATTTVVPATTTVVPATTTVVPATTTVAPATTTVVPATTTVVPATTTVVPATTTVVPATTTVVPATTTVVPATTTIVPDSSMAILPSSILMLCIVMFSYALTKIMT